MPKKWAPDPSPGLLYVPFSVFLNIVSVGLLKNCPFNLHSKMAIYIMVSTTVSLVLKFLIKQSMVEVRKTMFFKEFSPRIYLGVEIIRGPGF